MLALDVSRLSMSSQSCQDGLNAVGISASDLRDAASYVHITDGTTSGRSITSAFGNRRHFGDSRDARAQRMGGLVSDDVAKKANLSSGTAPKVSDFFDLPENSGTSAWAPLGGDIYVDPAKFSGTSNNTSVRLRTKRPDARAYAGIS